MLFIVLHTGLEPRLSKGVGLYVKHDVFYFLLQ